MSFQFDFRLEDATQAQAEVLLETICTWADRRNCWIAGGYHRLDPATEACPDKGREVKSEDSDHPGDTRPGPGPDDRRDG